jgi:uncharacterized protein with von Willebrand factor type A (vWA) domain
MDPADLATVAARFGARLRGEGLTVGPERTARFAHAVTLVRPIDVRALYACALATLVSDPADIPALDRVFAVVFHGVADPAETRGDPNAPPLETLRPPSPRDERRTRSAPPRGGGVQVDVSTAGLDRADDAEAQESPYPALAAAAERLGHRDFASLGPDELALMADLMRRFALTTPLRRSRRWQPSQRGRRIDLRTTMRRALRSGGYPVRLARHGLRTRHRRLVVLVDISGSMEPYARALLQLVYAAAGGPRAEVFTFATRLTRLTRALHRVRPEVALERAGRAAPDWSGGTRIGEALRLFNRRYGARGMARGAVILVISDGWDTGDPAVLEREMRRLSRLAYRIVWANPRTANPDYQPLVRGMAAAWPYCDAVVSAHSLVALDELLTALAKPR